MRMTRFNLPAAALLIFGVTAITLPCLLAAQTDQPQSAQADASTRIAEAWTRLTSDGLGLAERAASATELLEMSSDEATGALSLALTTQQSRVGWRAVIQAVATFPGDPPSELASPLIGLLGQVDAGLSQDLAAALGRFDKPEVIKQLTRIARSSSEPIARRSGAVLTLGHDRTQATAKVLMELTSVAQPQPVQQAAFQALGILSALDHYDADRQAWATWWQQTRGLWGKEWTQHLLSNFERREARRRAGDHQLEDKLLESQRALYQANSDEGKPGVLVYMLRDPLTPIRLLGMDLTEQRLLDDLPFDEPLREALRATLTDPVPAIRQNAALRLSDLADAPAAALVAQQLASRHEQVSSVLGAYLGMMARLPQPTAVDPAIRLLGDQSRRADAAAALAAAFDADMMNRQQVKNAAKLARKNVQADRPPAPQVITLMGKVGSQQDWDLIAKWVDHQDDAVKTAAAQAWADSTRSLNHLAHRFNDPVIQPILIAAATRRGSEPSTLRMLAANRPQRESSVETWRQALVAMASRVPADAVLTTDRQLAQLGESPVKRLEVLSAAIDRDDLGSLDQADRLELLLTRGEVRLNHGDPATSLDDFTRVAAGEADLSESQLDRLGRGQIRANLLVGQVDPAFVAARKLLGSDRPGVSPTDDRIVHQFIQTAHRFRQLNRKEEVATIVRDLRQLLAPAIKPEVGQQLTRLDDWVNGSAPAPQPLTQVDEPDAVDGVENSEGPAVE